MDSFGRPAATTISVSRTTVAGDHLDAGMGLQPGCEAVRLAVGQQVNDSMAFQVDEDRAVALAALLGPVVHSKHARRRAGRRRRATADEAQQGGAAHGRADPFDQARAGLAAIAEGNPSAKQPVAQRPEGASPMWCCRLPRRAVRWAYGPAAAGRRSAKMRCAQPGRPQRGRRTCTSTCTRRPCQGRSASRRG